MRFYSNKILRVPHDIVAHKHVFMVRRVQPALLTSKSSLALLAVNRQYYLYDNFLRYTALDHLPNYQDVAIAPYGKLAVYLPMAVAVGDRIVIYDDDGCNAFALA